MSFKSTSTDKSMQLAMLKILGAGESLSIGLTGGYLFNLLKEKLEIEHFQDVYSADTVPLKFLKSKGKPRTCIVNCAESSDRGTHFITLLVRPSDILVLDSLSLNLQTVASALYKLMLQSKKQINYAFTRPLQDLSSAFCGLYCAYFCVYLSRGRFNKGRDKLETIEEGGKGKDNDRRILNNLNLLIRKNI